MLKQLKIKLFQLLKILNKKILFFLTLVFLNSSAYSQWTNQNPVPDGNHLRSVFFIDDSTGWMVGSDGFIAKTTNAGVDWIRQVSGVSANLKAVKFINKDTGWAVGELGSILKTIDGGAHWVKLFSNTDNDLNSIDCFNVNSVFVCGNNGTMLKTNNGGLRWDSIFFDSSVDFFTINSLSELSIWIAGSDSSSIGKSPVMFHTSDSGNTWKSQNLMVEIGMLYSLDFVSEEIGYVIGSNGIVLKTTNGGFNWIKLHVQLFSKQILTPLKQNVIFDGPGGFRNVFFKDENIGWIVGGENQYNRIILYTSDGGNNWIRKYVGFEEWDLFSVFVTNSGSGWAVGAGGSIFISNDDGFTWDQQFSGLSRNNSDDIYSMFFVDEMTGYAVGKRNDWIVGKSLILKTTNAGKIWKTVYLNDGFGKCNSVYFVNADTGWVNCEDGGLIYTSNGGIDWNYLSTNIYASTVFFIDNICGFLAGESIYKTSDSGRNWVNKFNQSTNDVFFLDNFNGWAVGNNGLIIKTTDGGENWNYQSASAALNLNSVCFYNINFGVCVGDDGVILVSNDGGSTWLQKFSGTSSDLKSISIVSKNNIWLAGKDGALISTTNAGDYWNLNYSVTSSDLNSIVFTDKDKGWAAGLDGTIFSYKSESYVPVELVNFNYLVSNNSVNLSWKTASETNNAGFQVERRKIEDSQSDLLENIGFIEGYGTTSDLHSYNYIDENLIPGKYRYRLKQIDFNGIFEYSNEIEAEIISPQSFALEQNYPNPFNPSTRIQYQVSGSSKVTLKVYDILGNEVATLVDEFKPTGSYQVDFSAAGGASQLASGVYIYKLEAGAFIAAKKMVLVR